MPTLYLITGPAGVGKSTVSKEIAKNKTKSALIEGDDIYHQIISGYIPAWKEGNHLETFWKVCKSTIKTYLEDGYDVVLLVDEKTLLLRDKERPKNYQMKDRCITLLNSFKTKNYNTDNILDTTYLSIEETINIIETEKRFIL